ncbi:MAG: hypothetical protein QOJ17_5856 [Rhodospirillaceae bacterium]|nr:hypothetical protein [Rhodospirillaceae bacterium]
MILAKSEKSGSPLPAHLYTSTANDRRNVTALRLMKTTSARSEIPRLTAGVSAISPMLEKALRNSEDIAGIDDRILGGRVFVAGRTAETLDLDP